MKVNATPGLLKSPPTATAATLIVLSLSELFVHIGGMTGANTVGRISFLLLCILIARDFGAREWVLSLIAAALAIGHYMRPHGGSDILFALDRAAFFGAFIYTVTLLKEAAQRSGSVLMLGHYITQQPTGRRYFSLAAGSHLMGVLLNFGAVSLLTPLIQRGARSASENLKQVAIAEQQQISALLRGFAWMIMWSPTALTQAVLFTAFPSVNLSIVIALGISATIVMVLVGRLEDRLRWRGTKQPIYTDVAAFPRHAAMRFSIICLTIISCTIFAMKVFDVSAALGLMLVAPLIMAVWIFAQELEEERAHPISSTVNSVLDILRGSSGMLGRNAFTLGAAGFIGEAAARLLPVASFANALSLDSMPDWLFLMALPIIITLGGQIALSPILIVVFLSAIINQLPILPADPNLIVFALGAGWAMSMTASPNASATLLISGVTNIPPTTLTWRWNGVYSLMCYAVFSVSFVILTNWLPG